MVCFFETKITRKEIKTFGFLVPPPHKTNIVGFSHISSFQSFETKPSQLGKNKKRINSTVDQFLFLHSALVDLTLVSFTNERFGHMGVSKNNGTPKSSILIGFFIINHPFGVPLFLETPICWEKTLKKSASIRNRSRSISVSEMLESDPSRNDEGYLRNKASNGCRMLQESGDNPPTAEKNH